MALALIFDEEYLDHETGEHPESPARLSHAVHVLKETGIWQRAVSVRPKRATADDVALVHHPAYIRRVAEFARNGGGHMTPDTVVSPRSYEVALLAVGGAMGAIDAVFSGVAPALCLLRPPGHHAEAGAGMGFCLFNNVAVAARYALVRYRLNRVMVVDWDLHHGNGTERIFYEDDRVLFLSVHQSPAYPGTGWIGDVGWGRGEGYSINIPVPPGTGDEAYWHIFERVVLPVAERFAPELVLVSAGMDGHFRDPIGGLMLTSRGYAKMAWALMQIAQEYSQGRLVFILEGGYDLEGLGSSLASVAAAVTGLKYEVGEEVPVFPWDEAAFSSRLEHVIRRHAAMWDLR